MMPPHDDLVLFDGACNFCVSSVQFIIRHDKREKFRFVSLQSELGREIRSRCGLDPNDLQTFLVLTGGRPLVRSDAALAMASSFGGPWRLLAVLKIVPRPLRDTLYTFIAKRRYRWFGRRESCMVPSADLRKRFLA